MLHFFPRFARVIIALSVVFCCTAITPAMAQSSQTYTLNGLWADVISPAGPVRLGDWFAISVALRPHGDTFLREFHVFVDGRPLGRRDRIEMTSGYGDGIPENREWFDAASLYATPGDIVLRITVTEAAGRGGVIELPLRLLPATDDDADTLPDFWEIRLGLSPGSASGDDGPDGDPDGDGVRNRDEFARNTHPRGFHTRYFAEGITNDFFDTSFPIMFVPTATPGTSGQMHVRMVDAEGWAVSDTSAYYNPTTGQWAPPSYVSRRALVSSFATIIESDTPFVAERTTKWPTFRTGSLVGYGSHTSEGTAALSTRWLFAEGVTGSFQTYVALLNPSPRTATLTVTYLGANGVTPVVREHTLAPDSRVTLDVNTDAAGLASTDVAIVIDSTEPIAAERSIYRNVDSNVGSAVWGAGTSSTGTPAAAAEWFFAEGLSNPLFDTYLLLLNPGTTAAQVEIGVLRADGTPITLTRTIAPRSRITVHINSASPELASPAASTSFGLAVRSIGATPAPIVAERTMWWNDPVRGTRWVEGHTSVGARETATRWLVPGNAVLGPAADASVYLLLANPGAAPATVKVTLPSAFTGMSMGGLTMTVPAYGRATLDVSSAFPPGDEGQPDGRYSPVLVESVGDTPVPIVAERSVYANTLDVVWELGSNTLLTPLPPSTAAPGVPQAGINSPSHR
jgi:hypothetical protein